MSEKPESFQVAKQLTLRAIEELTEENVRLRLKNGRLREALKLAFNSHGRMLLTDPPQDPWKVNRVDEVIRELLQEVPR
jgi:regulator of replication initiation timing